MQRIERAIAINASADRVWQILVDFERYPEWNPFVISASGEACPGRRLTVRIQPPGERAMTFRPRVLVATPGRELRWLGRLLVPGIFDGEHSFTIEPTSPGSCRLVQAETFKGILVALLGGTLRATAEGFDQMNEALKARAEDGNLAA
jgi:hypothetical protein